METLSNLYRIGMGPSSSHTMGPRRAAEKFKKKVPNSNSYKVTLYGSLAATGKGHLTDRAILETLAPKKVQLLWEPKITLPFNPNGMKFEALDAKNKYLSTWTVYSVGGGALWVERGERKPSIFPHKNLAEILNWAEKNGKTLWQYVFEHDKDSETYLLQVWKSMQEAIWHGLEKEGVLPGVLKLSRKAHSFYTKSKQNKGILYSTQMLFCYALAIAEENADGGIVVTAPTCGSAGVLPAVLYHLQKTLKINDDKIIKALATAGIIGNIVKENGSISGAEVGCQGEIGVACAMAAGAAAQLLGGTIYEIEYAAEMGIEHHLGLTCDPVGGLVQIPCIERNAVAAVRALDCAAFALLSDGRHRVSFDQAVKTMMETGKDLQSKYRETSLGGLAKRTISRSLCYTH
ncbi:MAG: L-serine ammonia-lyase [Nanoarchaeota archaeon]